MYCDVYEWYFTEKNVLIKSTKGPNRMTFWRDRTVFLIIITFSICSHQNVILVKFFCFNQNIFFQCWNVVRTLSLRIYVLTMTDGWLSELVRRTMSGNSALSYLFAWPDACHGRKQRWTIRATPDIKTGTTRRLTSPRNRNYFSWSAHGRRGEFSFENLRMRN